MTTVAQYAPTPYEITKCGDPFALAVWNAIRQYHQINVTGGKWIHNMVFYAKELQLSVETVRRKIQFLIKKGFLTREKRNHYQFGYNYEIPEEWLCLTEEQLVEYRKHRKVTAKTSKKSSKKSEAEKPKNFAQNLELSDSESHELDEGHINKDLIKKEIIKEEREESTHTFNINEFQIQEESKPEKVVEKPILRSELTLNNKNLNQDKSSGRVVQEFNKNHGFIWSGEWCDENGFYKEGFLKWKAVMAMSQFKDLDTELKAMNWVEAYFKNDRDRVVMAWNQYQREFNFRAENAQTRLNHGCELRQEEKEKLGQMMSELNLLPEQTKLSEVKEEAVKVETVTVTNDVVAIDVKPVEKTEETVSKAMMKNIINPEFEEQEQPSRLKSVSFILDGQKEEKQAVVEKKEIKKEVKGTVLTDEFGNGAVINDCTGLAEQQAPTNWRSKFNFGLMGCFKSLGGKEKVGMDFASWCKTPEVTAQFVAWAKAKDIVEECKAYERYYNLPTIFTEE